MTPSSSDPSESHVASGGRRPKLRAPTEQGGMLFEPPLSELTSSLRLNAQILTAGSRSGVLGEASRSIRSSARSELLQAAIKFTTEVGLSLPADADGPWIVAGHQPSLFHPGVWAKNFFAAAVARRCRGRALNLIVDNDAVGTAAITVPSGDRTLPRIVSASFATLPKTMAWEEASADTDSSLLSTFPDRVGEAGMLAIDKTLLPEFWSTVLAHASGGRSFPLAISIARAKTERQWGAGTLELPISRLSETAAFRLFVARLATEGRRVATVYNSVLEDYRRRHRIRSRSHPVSDLKVGPEWVETPFWTWKVSDTTRRRLHARPVDDGIELSDGESTLGRFPACSNMSDAAASNQALEQLSHSGVRIRPRALSTTLFARLFFADLFVHGIGGAVYDEMTDELITRLAGIPAPRFQTVTGTLRLPFDVWPVTPDDVSRAKQNLRDMRYNPERHLPATPSIRVSQLMAAKQMLLREQSQQPTDRISRRDPQLRRAARQRFLAIQGINHSLFNELTAEYERSLFEIETAQQHLAANGVLTSREYSFVLHNADSLRTFFQSIQRQCESLSAT